MNKKDTNHITTEKWHEILYSEAWNQYKHEDNLVQSRNQMYLTILTLLLSVCIGIVTFLLGRNEPNSEISLSVNVLISGIVLLIFSIIILIIVKSWSGVTDASKHYVNMRFLVAKDIENKFVHDNLGLAQREDYWKMNELPSNYIGGIKATKKIISAFKIVCGVLISISVILIILAF